MTDRLKELLDQHDILYGIICRDPTMIELELIAQAGYHLVWVDLQHGAFSVPDVIRTSRTISHLGMFPLVRVGELLQSEMQRLLDGGVKCLLLPLIRDAAMTEQFVRFTKFPPVGELSVGSCGTGTDYTLSDNTETTLQQFNEQMHLMVQFECDRSLANLDSILQVNGIDMVTIGPLDWAVGLGLSNEAANPTVAKKADEVLIAANQAGKITAMGISSAQQADHYSKLGVRLLFVGVDIALKRKALYNAIEPYRG
jgi:2-keto-3-deoxy-L-rhamnonate aldolase RhmA